VELPERNVFKVKPTKKPDIKKAILKASVADKYI